MPTGLELLAGQGPASADPSSRQVSSPRVFQIFLLCGLPPPSVLPPLPSLLLEWSRPPDTQARGGDGKKTVPISCWCFLYWEAGKSNTAMPVCSPLPSSTCHTALTLPNSVFLSHPLPSPFSPYSSHPGHYQMASLSYFVLEKQDIMICYMI